MERHGSFSALGPPVIERAIDAAERDARVVGLLLGGSAVSGGTDEFSDLDLVVVVRAGDQPAAPSDGRRFAERLGPLLACFTGEHVGEPRLLICLFGPPLLHVDLKFVTLRDLSTRVEDPIVLWEREPGLLARALQGTTAEWPAPDLQWIEDRFWVWVHYVAAKIGRGELYECLDALAALRRLVFGPLLSLEAGARSEGARRLEQRAGELSTDLEATVGDLSRAGCVEALRASVDLYRKLRERVDAGGLSRRTEAERLSDAYLEAVARSG